MGFKDLFSPRAAEYARFRPSYPSALFAWLAEQAPARALAVDVGAGPGQAAVALARDFERVMAIDPSAAQLAHAPRPSNVEYRVAGAAGTGVAAASADLVVAAQAFHWFDHQPFFAEVRRIARPGALLAVWCYGVARSTPEIDAAVNELYEDLLGPYWEPERRWVEEGYSSLGFPFPELAVPSFDMSARWTFEQLVGYLGTWSPRRRFLEARGKDALECVLPRLQRAWGEAAERELIWPLYVRAFRL